MRGGKVSSDIMKNKHEILKIKWRSLHNENAHTHTHTTQSDVI